MKNANLHLSRPKNRSQRVVIQTQIAPCRCDVGLNKTVELWDYWFKTSNMKKHSISKGTKIDGSMNRPQNAGKKAFEMRGQRVGDSDLGGKWGVFWLTKKRRDDFIYSDKDLGEKNCSNGYHEAHTESKSTQTQDKRMGDNGVQIPKAEMLAPCRSKERRTKNGRQTSQATIGRRLKRGVHQ